MYRLMKQILILASVSFNFMCLKLNIYEMVEV